MDLCDNGERRGFMPEALIEKTFFLLGRKPRKISFGVLSSNLFEHMWYFRSL
jgi:hypothetical protein